VVDEVLAGRCAGARRDQAPEHQAVSARHVSAMLCADFFSGQDEMTRSRPIDRDEISRN
jgi:hypothetical protein